MKYLERSDWNAAEPRKRLPMPSNPKGIAIHWVGARINQQRDPAEVVQGIQEFHQGPSRGWWDIAYQECVALDGTVLRGRGFNTRSGANGKSSTNRKYGAICLLMGPGQDPTPEIIAAVRQRIAAWRRLNPKAIEIVGHGNLKQTTCPGSSIFELIRRGDFEPGNPPPGELPSPAPSSGYPVPTRTLKQGHHGTDVAWVQYQLSKTGLKLSIDSDFGPKTGKQVRAFQAAANITVDAIVGPLTVATLLSGALS